MRKPECATLSSAGHRNIHSVHPLSSPRTAALAGFANPLTIRHNCCDFPKPLRRITR